MTVVIKKAINARREAAFQRHEEIQTTAVLALLALAKTLPVLERGLHVACSFAGSRSVFLENHQVGNSASPCGSKTSPSALVGSVLPTPSHQNASWGGGAGGPAALPCFQGRVIQPSGASSPSIFPRQLLCQLGALGKKKEQDDVSVPEPTSNALNLATARAWGRGQARRWMQNAFKCRFKLDINLLLRAGGEFTHPLLRTTGGKMSHCWRWPLEPSTAAPAPLLPKSMSEGLRASPTPSLQ